MKYMLHGNTTIILLTVRLIKKKDIVEMSEHFRKPRTSEENC